MSSNGTASTLVPSIIAPSPSSPVQPAASSPASPASPASPTSPSVTPAADSSAAPAPSSPAPAQSNAPSSAEPPSSQAPAPSSAPVNTPTPSPSPAASSAPPAASSAPPASSAPAQSSAAPNTPTSQAPAVTRTTTAPSAPASATEVLTSIIVVTPTPDASGVTQPVITITSVITPSNQDPRATNSAGAASSSPSSTDAAGLQGAQKESSNGLSTGGKTAIAVVIPVVVIALLVLGAIFFWRRRKQRMNNEEERRKEVEEYGYNPNHDPTLPAVGVGGAEMAEDSSGYRGWGNTATSSGRKASTTLTSGMTYSDSASNPGGYISPNSPTNAYSDANSNDPLVNGRRETLDADGIAALGAIPTAANNQTGVARGPSNASSSYSAANHSDNSGEYPGMPNNQHEYYEQGYGSYQEGPYSGNGAYGAGQQPVIRDVSARRNTRIENPSVFPQGNSGVATNF